MIHTNGVRPSPSTGVHAGTAICLAVASGVSAACYTFVRKPVERARLSATIATAAPAALRSIGHSAYDTMTRTSCSISSSNASSATSSVASPLAPPLASARHLECQQGGLKGGANRGGGRGGGRDLT